MSNEADQMEIERQQTLAVLRQEAMKMALAALSTRLLTLAAMLLNSGAVAWCMINPDVLRVVAALMFAVTTWCLINIRLKGE